MVHTSEHNLTRLSVVQRQRHALLFSLLQRAVHEILESEYSLDLRFPRRESTWMILAEFINLERQCENKLRFALILEASQENVWLRVVGDLEVLEIFKTRLFKPLP
jgi:hypothetical protein